MKLKLTLLIFCYGIFYSLAGQDYNFRSISLDDGLSQSSINTIGQDQKGFVWFGTQNGLNRFDGINVRVYKNDPFDQSSISDNYITAILVDQQDRLWVGTRNGLNLFDAQQDAFQRFHYHATQDESIPANEINQLYEDNDGQIWVATTKGICRIKPVATDTSIAVSFDRIHFQAEANLPQENAAAIGVNSIYQDQGGNFWLGTTAGIFRYTATQLKEFKGNTPVEAAKIFPDFTAPINAFCEDSFGTLWFATQKGLFRYEATKNVLLAQVNFTEGVNDLVKTREGSVMIAGQEGLFKMSYPKGKKHPVFTNYSQQSALFKSFPSPAISIVKEDISYDGLFWVGTAYAGVIRMYKLKKDFHSDHLQDLEGPSSFVKYLLQDQKENLWIGLKDGLYYQPKNKDKAQVFTHFKTDKAEIATRDIHFLFQDQQGTLWAGMQRGGIVALQLNASSTLEGTYLPDLQKIAQEKTIFSMYEDDKYYFLGTSGGIYLVDKKQKKLASTFLNFNTQERNPQDCSVLSFLKDRHQNFWIGTNYGLILYKQLVDGLALQTRQASHTFHYEKEDPKSLPDNQIYDLHEDTAGRVWVATNNGMAKVYQNEKGYAFKNYNEKHGLANNVIYGILEDKASACLWTSSNNGLARFDPIKERFNNFNHKDGLQSNEFNPNAFFQTPRGEMFFGGVNGYTHFFPSAIILDDNEPFVWITQLQTLDGEVFKLFANEKERTIRLKADQNSFTIAYVGIDYLCPWRVNYYYDLEGGDAQHISHGNNRSVNFSKLSPGKYTFVVKASNRTGNVNEKGDQIHIVIEEPLWQTSEFYLCLIAVLTLLVWCVYHVRYQLKLQKIAEIEKIRKNAAEDFHDELGSKLSIISLYGELTKQQLNGQNEAAQVYLNKVVDNSNSLYSSMKDLLWTLNPEQDSINDLFVQLQHFGEELFYHSGIDFNTLQRSEKLNHNPLPMNYKRHILLVFKEAMNNALKHADCAQTTLKLTGDKYGFSIEFIDDGVGFDPQKKSLGDGLRNMKTRAKKISGQLFVERLLQGTRVKLVCPLG